MIAEQLANRKARYRDSIDQLKQERQQLQDRAAVIDRTLHELSGALYEIEQIERDLATETAIADAQKTTTEDTND